MRATMISQVVQDPIVGTFADFTIEENLVISYKTWEEARASTWV